MVYLWLSVVYGHSMQERLCEEEGQFERWEAARAWI